MVEIKVTSKFLFVKDVYFLLFIHMHIYIHLDKKVGKYTQTHIVYLLLYVYVFIYMSTNILSENI